MKNDIYRNLGILAAAIIIVLVVLSIVGINVLPGSAGVAGAFDGLQGMNQVTINGQTYEVTPYGTLGAKISTNLGGGSNNTVLNMLPVTFDSKGNAILQPGYVLVQPGGVMPNGSINTTGHAIQAKAKSGSEVDGSN